MDKEREEKLFMLRLFRFVYQIFGAKLPNDLQKEIEQFPDSEYSYFTDSIGKAVLILMNERFDTKDLLPPLDSDHFLYIARETAAKYDPLDFLKFCSWYVMRAASAPDRATSKDYKTAWSAIERVFKKAKEDGGFNSETWDKLDETACKVVDDDYIKCRRIPDFDPKKKLDLEEENAFVLRLMQHVFSLNFKELPAYYEDKLQKLDDKDYKLSDSVRNSLHCLLETQNLTTKLLGENVVNEYIGEYNFNTTKFKSKEFLEYCACFSRQACDDYYVAKKSFTPYKVHDSCVKILQSYRQKGLPIPWDEIEFAADKIIEDNEYRLRDEAARQACHDNKSRVATSELQEYVPLLKAITESQKSVEGEGRSTSEESNVACSCCMCS